jgi:hypothetical protein
MLPKRRPRVSERDSREEAKKSDEGAGAVDDGSTSECLQIYEISAHVISPGYSSKDNATADQVRATQHGCRMCTADKTFCEPHSHD